MSALQRIEPSRRPKRSMHLVMGRIPEPIPVAPFIEWCDKRQEHHRRNLNAVNGIKAKSRKSNESGNNYTERLMFDLGWDVDHGPRRLSRWRNPTQGDGHSGYADRDIIETALRHAGVRYEDVYPPRWPSLQWRALALIVGELVDVLTGACVQTRWCIGCDTEVEAVDTCLWCDSETVPLHEGCGTAVAA